METDAPRLGKTPKRDLYIDPAMAEEVLTTLALKCLVKQARQMQHCPGLAERARWGAEKVEKRPW